MSAAEGEQATLGRQVSRPRPTLTLLHDWRWRGRPDIHGHRRLKVQALFSFNEDDADGLPNEIVVRFEHGQDRSESIVRLSRDASGHLIKMLNDALMWDGQ